MSFSSPERHISCAFAATFRPWAVSSDPRRGFFGANAKSRLNQGCVRHTYRLPNYRTCLWLRADRWGFGQEAEATPMWIPKGPRGVRGSPGKVGSRKANR